MRHFLVFLRVILLFSLRRIWHLKKEEIVNMTVFILFTFLELHNIRGTYSKYFQNMI